MIILGMLFTFAVGLATGLMAGSTFEHLWLGNREETGDALD